MKIKICPICSAVAGTWLLLTALTLSGYLNSEIFLPLISLLMGGSVVGIAYQIGKRKPLIIGAGMLLAFWAARNLSFKVLILEILVLGVIGYFLFLKPAVENPGKTLKSELEEKLKDCC